ncbi:GNAT family N-acetyltransferase [Chondrinema litorale]|uniref:GNAT family N-acetyltransferase n=1 Tax=Chondrinema litorale TaxID=2994555 RepID=UPI0025427D17|nr:GNAT family N-acetyltransferase [Chondrinema litorale]UZR99206.1 GNAT family N-acetyltransferase [Chondrinema litorale]
MNIEFTSMQPTDWQTVATIYKQGIDTGQATFQQEIPEWESWDKGHLQICRILAKSGGEIAGWAALSPISSRAVYRGVTEVSVYISPDFRGKKIGKKLLAKLIEDSEANGIWTLQASIFPENKASLKIHQDLGFRQVGYREKIGAMNGIWRDTILLERRSQLTGK